QPCSDRYIHFDAIALTRARRDLSRGEGREEGFYIRIPSPSLLPATDVTACPSFIPTGGTTITVSPPERPDLTSTPSWNSRPSTIAIECAASPRTTQTEFALPSVTIAFFGTSTIGAAAFCVMIDWKVTLALISGLIIFRSGCRILTSTLTVPFCRSASG